MSELFFDTIDESEIPAGMARVRYEAGAVEPLYANDEFFSLLGYQRRSPDDFYPLDVRNSHGWRAFCGQLRAHIEAGETDFEIEVNQETATGTLLWTMARCRHDARRGTVTCLVLDVSSWMDTSERLRMSEDAFRIAAQMSGKNIATFDLADRALTMQGAVEGYLTAPARMVNVPDSAIAAGMIAPEHVELYRSLYRDMETGVPRGGVMLRMRDFDTRRFRWYQVDYSLVFDGENRPVYAVVAFGDTTERHERELVQKARAERDALTGVLNRATFEDGCTRIIERSEVDHGHALIMADLDRFKTTNDRYGHVAGDRVIVESVAGVVSAVLALVVGAGAGWGVWHHYAGKGKPTAAAQTETVETLDESKSVFVTLPETIVTLHDNNGADHYLSAELVMVVASDKEAEKIKHQEPLYQSIAVECLTEMKFEDLRGMKISAIRKLISDALKKDLQRRKMSAPYKDLLVKKVVFQ